MTRDKAVGASNHSLNLAAYGFFLFPIEGGTCSRFASPAVSGAFPHSCWMRIHGRILESSPHLGLDPMRLEQALLLQGCDLVLGPRAAASFASHEDVVDFSTLHCGAQLSPTWDAPAWADRTDVQVTLAGGALEARPDGYSGRGRYRWTACDGHTPILKSFTSLVVYSLPSWSGELDIVPRVPKGTHGRIVFDSYRVSLSLVNEPTVAPTDHDQLLQVDVAHAEANLNLCVERGPGPLVFPTYVPWNPPFDPNIRAALEAALGLPSSHMMAREIGGGLDVPPSDIGPVPMKGRPNCGARTMYL